MIFLGALVTATAVDAAVQTPARTASAPENIVHPIGLFDWLFGDLPRRAPEPQPLPRPTTRDEDETPRPQPRRQSQGPAATYRTLCVRLCDGFYFPISFATPRGKFGADAERCEHQCPGRSRLYAYRNPGEGIEQMLDLNGAAYTSLPTAFRFQSSYDSQCTCHGNPWDAESIARHQAYPPVQQPVDSVAGVEQRRTAEHRQSHSRSWGYRAQPHPEGNR
jgi:hypothetical protein